jgi:hypothetical protein
MITVQLCCCWAICGPNVFLQNMRSLARSACENRVVVGALHGRHLSYATHAHKVWHNGLPSYNGERGREREIWLVSIPFSWRSFTFLPAGEMYICELSVKGIHGDTLDSGRKKRERASYVNKRSFQTRGVSRPRPLTNAMSKNLASGGGSMQSCRFHLSP